MAAELRWMADVHKGGNFRLICNDQSGLRKDGANSGCGKLPIAEGMQDEVG